MLITKKQKRIINLSLLIALITIIVLAMGLGIYFIIKFGTSSELSKEQIEFGKLFNSSVSKPAEENIDISGFPDGANISDVVFVNDSYVAFKLDNGTIKIYDKASKEYLNISSSIDSVEDIIGDILISKQAGNIKLLDLAAKAEIVSADDALFEVNGKYILVKNNSFNEINVPYANEKALAFILDAKARTVVFVARQEDEIISINLGSMYFTAVYQDRTDVFTLAESFSLVKTYANNFEQSRGQNIESTLSGKGYYLSQIHSVYELGENLLLVETASITDSEDYLIKSSDNIKYNLFYSILDLSKNIELIIDNEGCVLRPMLLPFNNYYAINYIRVENKTNISSSEQEIRYFYIENSNSKFALKTIVKYDYVKYGKVVGFRNNKLLVSGGYGSGEIGFDGKNTEFIDTSNGQKVSMNDYSDAVIVNSPLGLKQVYNKEGKIAVSGQFYRVAPFYNGVSIAYDGINYYKISTKGDKELIVNFNEELADYVFMGINHYFVNNNGSVDVYNFNGEKIYKKAQVSVNLVANKTLLLSVVEDGSETKILKKITAQNEYFNYQNAKKLQPEVATSTSVRRFNGVRNAIESSHVIEPEINVDEVTKVGSATYSVNTALNSLSFVDYYSLDDTQLAMLPAFDSETTYISESGDSYEVSGVAFITGKNIALAVIRLYNGSGYCYLVTVAIKDAYLMSINSTSGGVCFENGKQNLPLDFSQNTLPAISLKGVAGLYGDEAAKQDRKVDVLGIGYDGAVVLAFGDIENLDLNIKLRNAYYMANGSTDYIDLAALTSGENTLSYGNYNVIINKGDSTTLTISALDGYIFTGLSVAYGEKVASTYEQFRDVSESKIDVVFKTYTLDIDSQSKYIRIKAASVVEEYYILNFEDYDSTGLYDLYYFYGYGKDATEKNNPAPLGFDNFFRKEKVEKTERVGYNFAGFKYLENDTEVINDQGAWITGKYLFSKNAIERFTLNAFYTPKQYSITYTSQNDDGDEIMIDVMKQVTYDAEVGELYDIVNSDNNLPGYNFLGWFDDQGKQYNEHTIYQVDGRVTLKAKWEPKTYEVAFNSNINPYADTSVNGYQYALADVQLLESFGNLGAGEPFENVTKTITYKQKYGQLPKIIGYQNKDALQKEKYTFIGWYTSPEFDVSDNVIVPHGELVDENTDVSASPAQTLYAHYVRENYLINIDVLGSDEVQDAGGFIHRIESLSYNGANNKGVKGEYSLGAIASESIENGDRYLSYTIQNEEYSGSLKIARGYYLAGVTIEIYDSNGVLITIKQDAKFDTSTSSNTFESINNDNMDVSFEDGALWFSLKNIDEAYNLEDSLLFANITIDIACQTFTNTFIVSRDGTDVAASVVGNSVEFSGDRFVSSGNIYGTENIYSILPNSVFNMNGELVNSTFLTKITISNIEVSFQYNYVANENGMYFYDVTATGSGAEISQDFVDSSVKTTTITIDFGTGTIVLTINYYADSNSYDYQLSVVGYTDISVSLEFEKLGGNVSLQSQDLASEKGEVLDINPVLYSGQTSGNATTNQTYITAENTMVYDIFIGANFVSSIKMKIGGQEYSLALPNLSVDADLNLVYNINFVAMETIFEKDGNTLTMKGTKITIEYLQDSDTIRIMTASILSDVEFIVSYLSMRQINVLAEEKTSFTAQVAGADALDNFNTIEPLVTNTQVVTTDAVNLYESATGFVYIILGHNNDVRKIKVDSLVSDEEVYIINRESVKTTPSSKFTLNDALTSVVFDGNNLRTASLQIEKRQLKVSVESYLSRGRNQGNLVYEKEPLSGFGLIADIRAVINDEEVEFDLDNLVLSFDGNIIKFRIYNITGYTLSSVTLKNGDKTITPSIAEQTGYKEYTFAIEDFNDIWYNLSVYQDAIEYEVHYANNFNDRSLGEEIAPTKHTYNVWTSLSTEGYSLTGFDLVGWAKEQKSGVDLTSADADFELGELLTENLSSTGESVTLYPVFVAKSYDVVYILNDAENDNGSSPASLNGENRPFVFGHALSTILGATRQGYDFVGWFADQDLTSGVTSASMLDDDLLAAALSDGNIVLYAKWQAKEYDLILHKNDSSEENGSTPCDTIVPSVTIVYDEAFDELLSLERIGYTFLGYKAVKLTSDQAKEDNSRFFGYGLNKLLTIDYSASEQGLVIDEENNQIDLYAVWIALSFRAYVNLNNQSLASYEKEDGYFVVTKADSSSVSSNTAFVDMFVDVEFDKQFGVLPTIESDGYTLVNYYNVSGNALVTPSGVVINAETILNYSLFGTLSYYGEDKTTTSLTQNYQNNEYKFSIYAYYTIKKYGVDYDGAMYDLTSSYHIEAIEDYNSYDYKNTIASDDASLSRAETDYSSDIILDLLTLPGYYYQYIRIKYTDKSKAEHVISLEFKFDNTGSVSLILQGGEEKTTYNQFIKLLDSTDYVADGIYVKMLPYNKMGSDSYDSSNACYDAVRLIFAFDGVKTNFKVEADANVQIFDVAYYKYFDNSRDIKDVVIPESYTFTRQIPYGTNIARYLDAPFITMFRFVEYYYGKVENGSALDPRIDGEKVNSGDSVKENLTLVALYEVSLKQAVNFYYFNARLNAYELRKNTSDEYILSYYDFDNNQWIQGDYDQVNYTLSGDKAGTLLRLPSPAVESWPVNTCFVGYVIATSAPAGGGYYSFSSSNTAGLNKLDTSVVIDSEINVYAVYNEQRLGLEMQLEGDTLSARADFDLYDINSDGSYRELEANEIFFVTLNEEQFEIYQNALNDSDHPETKEYALRDAITHFGSTFDVAARFKDDDFMNVDYESGKMQYFFAFIVRYNDEGEMYITLVSSNYYCIDESGNLTSH